nr:exonuclease domain-containing protein [Salinibacterium sp. ZJ454]
MHVDADGRIEGQWDTLVNPQRDLGRQDIHRIRASDVLDAPTFDRVAPRLLELLDGRVVVAHNASFDKRFLLTELERTGTWFDPNLVSLCTMQLARDFLPGAGRALADCCSAYDIVIDGAHRAAADAFATAQLLSAYIGATEDSEFWYASIDEALNYEWPRLDGIVAADWVPRPTGPAGEITAESFLGRISIKLPEHAGPAEYTDYLALLDRCLLDRQLSAHEAGSLVQAAESLGISRATCEQLHQEYFDAVAKLAWEDGLLTTAEMADMVAVGNLLDISTAAIAAAMNPPERSQDAATGLGTMSSIAGAFQIVAGDQIVLTGDMSRSREEWESDLRALGYVPKPAVTKKIKVVVAADPDSLSGKARKARDYGIPIVGEATLAGWITAGSSPRQPSFN